MKKQLLAIIALLAIGTLGHAMQAPKTFNYSTNGYNIPAQGLNIGDTFTITNIDPKVFSPETLKDANGKDWAKKTGSVYPYSGKTTPGRGTATFKVTAIPTTKGPAPAAQAARGKVAPGAAATVSTAKQGQIRGYTTFPTKPGYVGQQAGSVSQTAIRMAGSSVTPTSGIYPVISTTLPGRSSEERQAPITGQGALGRLGQPVPQSAPSEVPPISPVENRGYFYPLRGQNVPQTGLLTREGAIGQQVGQTTPPAGRFGALTETGRVATTGIMAPPATQTAEIFERPATATEQAIQRLGTSTSAAELEKSAEQLKAATERAKAATEKLSEEAKKISKLSSKLSPEGRILVTAITNADVDAVRSLLAQEQGTSRAISQEDIKLGFEFARSMERTEQNANKKANYAEILGILGRAKR